MRHAAKLSLSVVGAVLGALSCGENLAPPSTGTIEIITSTSGAGPDADGYVVSIDDGSQTAIGANASLRRANLSPGTHTVRLAGIAANCTTAGENLRPVVVEAGNTATVSFAITCDAIVDLTGNRIAFIADGNIASIREDGSNRAMLTRETFPNPGLGASAPLLWSPDGARLAVVQVEPVGLSHEIIVVAADGSGYRHVTSGFGYWGLGLGNWSPDGTRITYYMAHGAHEANLRLYIIGADGSGPAPLDNTGRQPGESDATPAWSPAGEVIAFRSYRITPASPRFNWYLFTITPAGSGLRQLPGRGVYGFKWAPDGRRFAVVEWLGGENAGYGNILVLDRDGSGSTRLSQQENVDTDPVWSPDGSRLAFTSIRDGNNEVYVMRVDGSEVQRLTNDPSEDSAPAWSPDGTHLAFQTNRDGNWEIYTVGVDGNGLANLTRNPGMETAPAWR